MKKIQKGESLKDYLSPEVLSEWDNDKNSFKPEDISKGSLIKTYWNCSYCEYSWGTAARNRYNGSGCPICSRLKNGDLTKTNPELLKEWAAENGNPKHYGPGHVGIVKWNCQKCSNQWEASIPYRIKGATCPYCRGDKPIKGVNDFKTLYPELLKEFDFKKNNFKPEEITAKCSKKAWWICELGHSYCSPVRQRIKQKTKCPICTGKQVLQGFNDLETLYPEVAVEWDYSKNKLKPSEITKTSSKKVWWKCEKGHSWKTSVAHRTSSKSNCQKCYFEGKKNAKKEDSFGTKFPNLIKEWDYKKNNVDPYKIFPSHQEKVWWKGSCGHSWEQTIKARRMYQSKPCPICAGRDVLVGFNDVSTTYPEISKEWSEKNELTPIEVTKGYDQKVLWKCKKGHEWIASVASRTFYNSRCPQCVATTYSSKGEKELQNFIKKILPNDKIILNSRKLIHPFELDILIPDFNIAIEFNGLYWHSEKAGKDKKYHYNKWKLCNDKGVQLITVWEDDWNNSQRLIKDMLKHKLNISTQEKIQARKTIIEEVSYKESSEFLKKNHIQGKMSGSKYLALKTKDTKEIVAVSVWRKHKNQVYLDRYATSKIVIGGLGKLLKFTQTSLYPNLDIVTFADHSVSNGELYKKLGFIEVSEIPPDYSYLVNGKREHKFNYRLKRFKNDPSLLWKEGLTEGELADLNGLKRIWDSGKSKYILPANKSMTGSKLEEVEELENVFREAAAKRQAGNRLS